MAHILADHHTWEYLGFILVVGLMLWKGVPGLVGKMLDERAAVISAELDEAKRLRAEAATLLADFQKRAAGAEAEAQAIVADAKAEAARFAEESRISRSSPLVHREENDFADVRLVGQQHDDAVDARRRAAVRRRAELEGVEHAAEARLDVFRRIAGDLERLVHDVGRWLRIAPEDSSMPLQTMSYWNALMVERVPSSSALPARPAASRTGCG
jgi:F-type H+-transporting ATPase subunit b